MCWGVREGERTCGDRCKKECWGVEGGKERCSKGVEGRCGERCGGVKKCGERYGVSVEGVGKCVRVSGSGVEV